MGYRLWLFAESQEDSGRSLLEAIKAVVIYFPEHLFELYRLHVQYMIIQL